MLGSALVCALLAQVPLEAPGVGLARAHGQSADVLVLLREGEDPAALLAAPAYAAVKVRRRYQVLPLIAAHADPPALAALAKDPKVRAVQLDARGHLDTKESAVAIHSIQARQQLGVDGTGVVVAVLDTGVEASHPDLTGAVVAQKCFVFSGCPGADGGPVGDLAPEGNGHGTHISGIITSDGVVAPPGIAPGAKLVMVRVFDDNAYGVESDWAAALDWLLAQREALGVRVVNMSLGADTPMPGNCDSSEPVLADAIGRLRDAGVISFVSAGNGGLTDRIDAPACISTAVAVGATYDEELGRQPETGTYGCGCFDPASDAGTVVCFSNASMTLDLLAPGALITSSAPGASVTTKKGTSAAAAHASAVAALMLQADPTLGPDELERLLEQTGVPLADPKSGLTRPLIQADRALAELERTACLRHPDGGPCPAATGCDGGPCLQGAPAAGVVSLPAAHGCGAAPAVAPALVLLWALALRKRQPRE